MDAIETENLTKRFGRRAAVDGLNLRVPERCVYAMTTLVFAFAWLGPLAGGVLTGRAPAGELPWDRIARAGGAIVGGAALMVMLQLWVALRFANFVVPLAFGIGGTLAAIRAGDADGDGRLVPLAAPDQRGGEGGARALPPRGRARGLVVLALMVADLSRREMRWAIRRAAGRPGGPPPPAWPRRTASPRRGAA